ncbi:olfactory receptor 10X1-like [Sphaerodactylus townsendi]|uniref:olfactory receptor 10X1-like n=1 Tax=Sphaerodactylus townsendi TaxID=933632 RepID=UPI00202764D4|nr:olfactory receptor 10X1-like [Sphaerodactylus townsendi]
MKKNQTFVTEFILAGFSVSLDLQLFLFVFFLLVYIITVIGNLLIIVIIGTDRTLHIPMYLFLFVLSFSESCYSLVIVPKMLRDLLAESKTISFAGCAAQMFFFLGLGGTNCFILTIMGFDRYLAICKPLHYPVLMNTHMILWLIAFSWVGGFLLSVAETTLIFRLPYCGSKTINHFFCHMRTVVSLACTDESITEVVVSTVSVFGLSGSFLFIILTYVFIFSTIFQIPSTDGWQKAFSTCTSHLIVVIMHYGFAAIVYLRPNTHGTLDNDSLISVPYTIITPLLSPVIFTLRNKDIQIAVRKPLGDTLALRAPASGGRRAGRRSPGSSATRRRPEDKVKIMRSHYFLGECFNLFSSVFKTGSGTKTTLVALVDDLLQEMDWRNICQFSWTFQSQEGCGNHEKVPKGSFGMNED